MIMLPIYIQGNFGPTVVKLDWKFTKGGKKEYPDKISQGCFAISPEDITEICFQLSPLGLIEKQQQIIRDSV